MNIKYIAPVIMVIIANLTYHNASKNTPQNVNTFLSLAVSYLVGVISAITLYFISGRGDNFFESLQKINWSSYLLGLSAFGIEVGYIYMYRSGWEISKGSLIANIAVAILLLFIGMFAYKESLSISKVLGIICCIGGLFLLNYK